MPLASVTGFSANTTAKGCFEQSRTSDQSLLTGLAQSVSSQNVAPSWGCFFLPEHTLRKSFTEICLWWVLPFICPKLYPPNLERVVSFGFNSSLTFPFWFLFPWDICDHLLWGNFPFSFWLFLYSGVCVCVFFSFTIRFVIWIDLILLNWAFIEILKSENRCLYHYRSYHPLSLNLVSFPFFVYTFFLNFDQMFVKIMVKLCSLPLISLCECLIIFLT